MGKININFLNVSFRDMDNLACAYVEQKLSNKGNIFFPSFVGNRCFFCVDRRGDGAVFGALSVR